LARLRGHLTWRDNEPGGEADKEEMTTFNCKFKAVAVKLVHAGGQSITQTAMNLDLTEKALRE